MASAITKVLRLAGQKLKGGLIQYYSYEALVKKRVKTGHVVENKVKAIAIVPG